VATRLDVTGTHVHTHVRYYRCLCSRSLGGDGDDIAEREREEIFYFGFLKEFDK
jgi:hypothetical protein